MTSRHHEVILVGGGHHGEGGVLPVDSVKVQPGRQGTSLEFSASFCPCPSAPGEGCGSHCNCEGVKGEMEQNGEG